MTLFCFGMGYAAQAVAAAWRMQGGQVAGTHRTAQGDGFVFSPTQPFSPIAVDALQRATAVLVSIPPDAAGDPAFLHYADILRQSPHLRWLGVFSTTGVYAETQGAWIDETAPVAAHTQRATQRLLAEGQWLASGLPAHVFRLSGIYGPGRSALDRARDGAAPIHKPGHVFNRIHVDDIAQAVMASMAQPTPGEIYNLSDDCPAPGDDVLRYAYGLLGKTPPPDVPFDAAILSPMAQEFYAGCKRVDAGKIRRALGIMWRYPDYKTGLASLLTN